VTATVAAMVVVIAITVSSLTGGGSPAVPVAVPSALLSTGAPDASVVYSTSVVEPPTAAPLYVHVVGGVVHPGLYRLTSGARVIDAVLAAGGLAPDGSQCQVNLARPVTDGEQIVVGQAPAGTPCRSVTSGVGGMSAEGARGGSFSLSLSSASAQELDTLPGIGPALAQRIIDYRDAHGGFRSVDQLNDVSGIGSKVMAQIAPLVTP